MSNSNNNSNSLLGFIDKAEQEVNYIIATANTALGNQQPSTEPVPTATNLSSVDAAQAALNTTMADLQAQIGRGGSGSN